MSPKITVMSFFLNSFVKLVPFFTVLLYALLFCLCPLNSLFYCTSSLFQSLNYVLGLNSSNSFDFLILMLSK